MLKTTELSGREVYVNIDLIERIYGGQDTLIGLLNGVKIVVKEKPEELLSRIVEFKRLCNERTPVEIVRRVEEDTETK